MELTRNDRGLVTFAVPEESRPFLQAWSRTTGSRPTRLDRSRWRFPELDVRVTGMGSGNARRSVEEHLQQQTPRWVITAGFAGGLDPGCPRGMVGLSSDPAFFLDQTTSGRPGTRRLSFHESPRVIPTPEAKAELWRHSGCHAVDMESATIRRMCHANGIPSATIRVISDDAGEALPLDFGALMGPDNRIDWILLMLTLLRSPSLVPELIRFQRRLSGCADQLAEVLVQVIQDLQRALVQGSP